MKWTETVELTSWRNGKANVRAAVCGILDRDVSKGGAVVAVDRVLRCAQRGSAIFVAVMRRDRSGRIESVRAVVCTAHTAGGFVTVEFTPEEDMVVGDDCPDVILDLLSETHSATASSWRARCRRKNALSRKGRAVGAVVKEADIEDGVLYECPIHPDIAETFGFKEGDVTIVRRVRCGGHSKRRVRWELEARRPEGVWVKVPARYIDKAHLSKAS